MLKLNLPSRTEKPRTNGITMVIDTGIPVNIIEGYLNMCASFIDYVKLGWGTSLVTEHLLDKIKLYSRHGVEVFVGGTLFELALLQGKLEDFKAFIKELNIKCVEISDGTMPMSLNEKAKIIEEFSKDFLVFSEIGSKDIEEVTPPKKWVEEMKTSLEAGAYKVIAEGRESGKAGLYRETTEVRTGLIREILDDIPAEKIIFEAPNKSQQVWFIKKIGSNVNLGNIAFKDIVSLETLRLGLRSDTLKRFHGGENSN